MSTLTIESKHYFQVQELTKEYGWTAVSKWNFEDNAVADAKFLHSKSGNVHRVAEIQERVIHAFGTV